MNISVIIAFTVGMIFIQGYVYKRWGMENIEYERYFKPTHVEIGQQVEMVERMSNRKWLPLPWVHLESKMDGRLQFREDESVAVQNKKLHQSVFSLMSHQQLVRRHRLTAAARGYYSLGTVGMKVGDPFGVSSHYIPHPVRSELVVYPQRMKLADLSLPAHQWQGDHIVRRWLMRDPFMVAGVRDYEPRDPMSTINWKQTARQGRLQVHEYEHTSDHHVLIYLNMDESDDINVPIRDTERIESAIVYAASIAEHALRMGSMVGFSSNARLHQLNAGGSKRKAVRIEPSRTAGQWHTIMEALAKLSMERVALFTRMVENDVQQFQQSMDIIVITTVDSRQLDTTIQTMKVHGHAVEVIHVPERDHEYPSSYSARNEPVRDIRGGERNDVS